jgi:hypothetical protein
MPGKKNYRSKRKKNKNKNQARQANARVGEQDRESEAQQPGEETHEAAIAQVKESGDKFLRRTLAHRGGKPTIQTNCLDSIKWMMMKKDLDDKKELLLVSRVVGIKCGECKRLAGKACATPGCMTYACEKLPCSNARSSTVHDCVVCQTNYCDDCGSLNSCTNCHDPVCDSCNTAHNGWNVKRCNLCGEKHCTLGDSNCTDCDHTNSNYSTDNCVIC